METNQNPLTMDLYNVDPSLPVLKGDTYDLRIHKAEVGRTKDSATAVLNLELKNANPATSVKGDSVNANQCTVFDTLMLEPRGKMTPLQVSQGVAELVQSVSRLNGDIRLDNVAQWHKQLEGQVPRCMVGYRPEERDAVSGKTYRAKNEIEHYLKKA